MLVSIVIVSYNAEDYIVECLDSINRQDYNEIELIVTDDCSKDNTVNIARRWIENHKDRFTNTIILENGHNTGVAPNCNRGASVAQGEWLKFLAADDYLYRNNSITDYVNSTRQMPNKVVTSNVVAVIEGKLTKPRYDFSKLMLKTQNNAAAQHNCLLYANFINACTVFLERDTFINLGRYDESIPMVEDAPMWIKYTSAGYPIGYIDKQLVAYRKHNSSLVATYKKKVNIRYLKDQVAIFDKYRINKAPFFLMIWFKLMAYFLKSFINKYEADNNFSLFSYKMYRIFKRPLNLYVYVKNIL